jgi:hypothetical protein
MGREFRRFRNGSRNSHRGRYQKAFRSFKIRGRLVPRKSRSVF